MSIQTHSSRALATLVAGALLFALVTLFNRFVPEEIGTFYQLLIRTLLMGALFVAAGFALKDYRSIDRKDWPLLTFRGLLIAGDFASFFIAANALPLGTALFLMYAGSVITSFAYGSLVLREKIDKVKALSLASALVGLAIIFWSDLHSLASAASLLALLTGVCFGLTVSTSKNLTDKYSVNQVNGVGYLTAAIISLPLLFLNGETINLALAPRSWLIMLVFSAIGALAFYTTLYGFKYIEAQRASLVLLAEIPFVLLIGLMIFQEIPTLGGIIGGLLILVALILPNLQRNQQTPV